MRDFDRLAKERSYIIPSMPYNGGVNEDTVTPTQHRVYLAPTVVRLRCHRYDS